jgi:N-acetylglucosamine-6-phosphate deacetylase
MQSVVTARRLFRAGEVIDDPFVVIEDGNIVSIGSRAEAAIPTDARHLEFAGATLAPAYVDVHIHGGHGHDIMEATPEGLSAVGTFLASRGVGAYLPTTVTAPVDATLRSLEGLAKLIKSGDKLPGAQPLGVHIEGPFLSHAKRGVHPPDQLQRPSIALFQQFWEAAEGTIRLMTVAPELDGALELIRHAASLGVRCSIGHSDATAPQARAGIEAGATTATHTFNAMRRIDHRDPGIAAVVLDDDHLFAELICDGVHVEPSMVRLFYKAKGPRRAILITDGISATGMPDGKYFLGGFEVDVANGVCMHNGVLAGSVLTLDKAVRNLVAYTRADWQSAVRMASANPAEMVGYGDRYGHLEEGRRADITVLSAEGNIVETILGGEPTLQSAS